MVGQADAWRILFSLFKVAAFLGAGMLIGFLLGLAYASHLFGTPPVVIQIQNWFAGDTLYQAPPAIDQADKAGHLSLLRSPVEIIPKLGACFGFAMAASVLAGSYAMRFFVASVSSTKKRKKRPSDSNAE